VDRIFEFVQRSGHAAPEPFLGKICEEALYSIEPGGRCRGEVEDEAWMLCDPFDDFRVLMSGVVVDDDVHRLLLRHLGIDGVEEADELLMTMALHASTEDLALKDIEGGKQGRDAMTLVVVGHGAGAAPLHRQSRLRAVERLNLALFIDREHHGMIGRIDVEADNLPEFAGELRSLDSLNWRTKCGLSP